MHRDGKPKGFFYLDHRTVDSKYNIITDVHVTAGNVNDTQPYVDRIKTQIEKFGFEVEVVSADAGYNTAVICKDIYDIGLTGVFGYRKGPSQKGNDIVNIGWHIYLKYICIYAAFSNVS